MADLYFILSFTKPLLLFLRDDEIAEGEKVIYLEYRYEALRCEISGKKCTLVYFGVGYLIF